MFNTAQALAANLVLQNKNIGFPDKETPPWKWWSFSEAILAEFRTDSHFLPCRRAHTELPHLQLGVHKWFCTTLGSVKCLCTELNTTTPRKQVSLHPALDAEAPFQIHPIISTKHWKCISCSQRHCALSTAHSRLS